jgi:uncharacterized damage-inducible protein DinB
MTESILDRLFAHSDWANRVIIDVCSALDPAGLDAVPLADSDWSIRRALTHLVEAQRGYLSLLTLPPDAREDAPVPFAGLAESARESGEALRSLARGASGAGAGPWLDTTDGYRVEPWVVLVQALNHATDHRRQICGMLRALGETAPRLDGWAFGEATGALVRVGVDPGAGLAEAPSVRSLIGHSLTAATLRDQTWLFEFADGVSLATEAPWRLIARGRVAAASGDHGHPFGRAAPLDAETELLSRTRGLTVGSAWVAADTGDLTIGFGDGVRLELLQPSAGYEAWRLAAGGRESVCTGGGEVREI